MYLLNVPRKYKSLVELVDIAMRWHRVQLLPIYQYLCTFDCGRSFINRPLSIQVVEDVDANSLESGVLI